MQKHYVLMGSHAANPVQRRTSREFSTCRAASMYIDGCTWPMHGDCAVVVRRIPWQADPTSSPGRWRHGTSSTDQQQNRIRLAFTDPLKSSVSKSHKHTLIEWLVAWDTMASFSVKYTPPSDEEEDDENYMDGSIDDINDINDIKPAEEDKRLGNIDISHKEAPPKRERRRMFRHKKTTGGMSTETYFQSPVQFSNSHAKD